MPTDIIKYFFLYFFISVKIYCTRSLIPSIFLLLLHFIVLFALITIRHRDVIKTFSRSHSFFFPQGDPGNNDYLFHCRISRISGHAVATR